MEELWKYYAELAKKNGRKSDGGLLSFSLEHIFYKYIKGVDQKDNYKEIKDVNKENELIRAFLGDTKVELKIDDTNYDKKISKLISETVKPYNNQKVAIKNALKYPVSVVQGPPGTGKTEMILNLISVIHGIFPERTIAVVSSNSEAISNIIEKLEYMHKKNEKGKLNDPRIGPVYDCFAKLGKFENRKEFIDNLPETEREKYFDGNYIKPELLKYYPIFSSTIHSLAKIFRGFDNQFDYVIVDECSQVSITLGLAAMSCAKRLVLIGDNNQLAPIISDKTKNYNKDEAKIKEDSIYREAENKSFLSVCENIFKKLLGNEISVMLNQHYRCHPSIIGFCNKYVYNNELDIKSEDDKEFRIRAIWYEGDYCEKIGKTKETSDTENMPSEITDIINKPVDPTESFRKDYLTPEEAKEFEEEVISGTHNMRQVEIFMQEELPDLLKRIEEEGVSVCVVSPYRAPLEVLKDRLEEYKQLNPSFDDNNKDNEDSANENINILRLTVHKAQGKGFDIVYMLTVMDYYENNISPWCQQMRMMNVAVSRAKKEFCIIASSQWLPENVQKELTGYVLPLPSNINSDNNKEDYFFCKMFEYITEKCVNPDEKDPQNKYARGKFFGLHKSELSSVFDKVPLYRQLYHTGKEHQGKNSAPSLCMNEALQEKFGKDYLIFNEVPMNYIEQTKNSGCNNAELLSFKDFSSLDIVICKGNDIKAIIEVDGSYHRSDKKQKVCDLKKDIWMKKILGAGERFIRFSTDGTSVNEIDTVAEVLGSSSNTPLTISDDKKEILENRNMLMNCLDSTISECLEELVNKTSMKKIPKKNLEAILGMNFQDPKKMEYDSDLKACYYICRYATAYAFEYALMYDIIMRSYFKNNKDLKICTFGCGSFIGAWSVAYSLNRLKIENAQYSDCTIEYHGVDLKNWSRKFVSFEKGDYQNAILAERFFNECDLTLVDLNEYIQQNQEMGCNVIVFSKILNELDNNTITNLINNLGQCSFNLDEYYICASHSLSKIKEGCDCDIMEKIVNIINKNKEFEVESDVFEMIGDDSDKVAFLNAWNNFAEDELIAYPENENNLKYFKFKSSVADDKYPTEISKINGDFVHEKAKNYLQNLAEILKKDDRVQNEPHVQQISRVSQMVFQIIRLKRKK